MNLRILKPGEPVSANYLDQLAQFLYNHLDQYGDDLQSINKAIRYALGTQPQYGGFVVTAEENDRIVGAVVMNETHMSGYIPDNILVYIAVDGSMRGKGVGGKLMEAVINEAEGDIALHVEADNPAKKLYERHGFTNPYLEMRLKK